MAVPKLEATFTICTKEMLWAGLVARVEELRRKDNSKMKPIAGVVSPSKGHHEIELRMRVK